MVCLECDCVFCVTLHLHHKALVVAASTFRDELVFKASSLLIQLHDRILPACRQYGTLSSHLGIEHIIVISFKHIFYCVMRK